MIKNRNYAIATRCAFADASGDYENHIYFDCKNRDEFYFVEYVEKIHLLLKNEYNSPPNDYIGYYNLGRQMMYDLLNFYGTTDEIDKIIHYISPRFTCL